MASAITVPGLSPRVRGNPRRLRWRRKHAGSIPACAGEPDGCQGRNQPGEVYPRVCGGTPPHAPPAQLGHGLSPRVRGNQQQVRLAAILDRSIPACAGEPRRRPQTSGMLEVYPRVCGGTLTACVDTSDLQGLSPRVRGNRVVVLYGSPSDRSIPACAGEPPSSEVSQFRHRVYPRVCGGTIAEASGIPAGLGLSPRVRGNRRSDQGLVAETGSIPACAGEPLEDDGWQKIIKVYPRVCGGTDRFHGGGRLGEGLSPRVRGNPIPLPAGSLTRRSIPACAGEPPSLCTTVAMLRVYPRVCGGTMGEGMDEPCSHGLSPRVRGNPQG